MVTERMYTREQWEKEVQSKKNRHCSRCAALKLDGWKFCPYCGCQGEYHSNGQASQPQSGQDPTSPPAEPTGTKIEYGIVNQKIKDSLCLIEVEMSILSGANGRLKNENVALRERIKSLEVELDHRKRPEPFHLGNVIGHKGGMEYFLQVQSIDYRYPLVHVEVRLP